MLRRFSILIMIAMVYVGAFKPHHAVGISLTDPTLIAGVLLCLTLGLQALFAVTTTKGPSLTEMFTGQMAGVLAFLLLMVIVAFSYSYTPAPGVGSDKVLKLIAFDVPLFIAPLLFLRDEDDVRNLVIFNLVASLALGSLTIYRLMHPSGQDLLQSEDMTQIAAGLALDATILTLLYYRIADGIWSRVALLICVVFLAVGVGSSISRSAIFCLFLVVGMSALLLRSDQQLLSRKALVAAVGVVVLVVIGSSMWVRHLPGSYSKFAVKTEELRSALQGSGLSGTVEERISFSQSAWNAFLEKPLLGWGAGGWSTLWHYTDGRVLTYPHDFVLEIAAEQGLVGLTFLGLLLLAMLGAAGRILRDPGRRFIFIVPVVALSLLGNCVTGQVDARDMWFWCGTLLALARLASQEEFGLIYAHTV